jgi:putative phosphoesterase
VILVYTYFCMKIAVLADIHANLLAFEAVLDDVERWQADRVIVAGDSVNRGPQSVECLALLRRLARERGWLVMQGNHEEYLLRYDRDHHKPDFPRSGPRYEVMRTIIWTYQHMAGDVAEFVTWPTALDFEFSEAGRFSVRHASTLNNRDGLLRQHTDEHLRERIVQATVFCTGHTHMPFVRIVDETMVVNVGSVGLPFDGDTRAAYARLTYEKARWRAEIVRLPYDLAGALRAFDASGLAEGVGDIGPIMRRELATGQSIMFDFVNEFHHAILANEITIAEAARLFTSRWK